ncbi:hypothetical protein FJZ53_02795 [Candidatus Woesearchaeota archaeon]|nr:hypothetical protein [Candidatus Woesearchaeota archaeon]
MKLTQFLIPALIVTLLIAGCPSGETTDKFPTSITTTDGLAIEFEEDSPPDTFPEMDDFGIALKVKNKGDYTIKSGGIVASLSGINQQDFSLAALTKKSNYNLERKDDDKQFPGGENSVDFGNAKYKLDLSRDFPTNIQADICYKYRTVAATSLCLKKDTTQYKEGERCAINNPTLDFENSAAPLKITGMSERRTGKNSINLQFTIENKESGDVYKYSAFNDKCVRGSKTEDRNEKDFVDIEVTDQAKRLKFKCGDLANTNKGSVKLYEGKKIIIDCTLDTQGLQENAYLDPIDVVVDYTYRVSISKGVTITNENAYEN